jgi:hypothetical protein
MRPMSESQRQPELPTPSNPTPSRQPGRSFTNPNRPLGEDMIERADPIGSMDPERGIYGRAVADHVEHRPGVPERAKAVAVLRKAEELMASGNPSGDTEDGRRRALELAAGRCGVHMDEYDRIVDADDEVQALQAAVFEAARQRPM